MQDEFQAEEEQPPITNWEEETIAYERARWAILEGKKEKAVAELRRVVLFREAILKRVAQFKGIGCGPDYVLLAFRELTVARTRLAEVEGDLELLVNQLPWVIRHYKERIELLQNALENHPDESGEVSYDLRVTTEEARKAKVRLVAVKKELSTSGDRPLGGKTPPTRP